MPKFPAKHTLTSDRLILTVSMVSAILLLYSHGMFIFPFSTELFFSYVKLFEFFLCILEIKLLSVALLVIFSSILSVVFSFCLWFISVQKVLSLIKFICLFLFYFHYSQRWINKDLTVIYVKECSASVFL